MIKESDIIARLDSRIFSVEHLVQVIPTFVEKLEDEVNGTSVLHEFMWCLMDSVLWDIDDSQFFVVNQYYCNDHVIRHVAERMMAVPAFELLEGLHPVNIRETLSTLNVLYREFSKVIKEAV